MADADRGGCLDSRGRMSRRKLRAAPALRAYIKRFAPKPAAPKAPPVDNPYHRFFYAESKFGRAGETEYK